LADLKRPTGIAGEAMLRAETPQEQFNLIGAGRRNILINGAMEISQRGNFSSEADAANDSFQLDRWKLRNSSGSGDVHVNVVTDDLPPVISNGYALRCERQSDASSSQLHFGHRQFIEDYAKYGGMTLTYSAWVKSNHPVRLWIFESGGSGNSAESESHPADGNWHFLQVSKVITDNITSLLTYVTPYGQHILKTGDYHLSTLHQLELGKVATPFEHRSYGEELALCHRYFQKLLCNGSSTRQMIGAGHYNGPTSIVIGYQHYGGVMRGNPTATLSALNLFDLEPFDSTPTSISLDVLTDKGCFFSCTDGTSRTTGFAGSLFLDTDGAFVSFDAEL
jgi:hypothetical protein